MREVIAQSEWMVHRKVVETINVVEYTYEEIYFRCPGCGWSHVLPVTAGGPQAPWTWNGDLVRPNVHPSFRSAWPQHKDEEGNIVPEKVQCHFHLQEGVFNFANDNPPDHRMNGRQGVPMIPLWKD